MSRLAALLLALWTTASTHAETFSGRDARLFELYYALEVASYCALVSPTVADGFATRARALEAEPPISSARRDHVRGKAWQAAHAEWQNRGLGGFRGWCRGEGSELARWLGSHADGAPAPRR